jgi:hypothetical protein
VAIWQRRAPPAAWSADPLLLPPSGPRWRLWGGSVVSFWVCPYRGFWVADRMPPDGDWVDMIAFGQPTREACEEEARRYLRTNGLAIARECRE